MSIIDEARQSLALTMNELHDEQHVLSLTSDKISQFPSELVAAYVLNQTVIK